MRKEMTKGEQAGKPFDMETLNAAVAQLSDEQIQVDRLDGMMVALGLNARTVAGVLMGAGQFRQAARLFRLAAACGAEDADELADAATSAADAAAEARDGRGDVLYLPVALYPNERVVVAEDGGTFRLCQDGLWAEVDPSDHASGPPERGSLTVEELEALSFAPLQWPADADSNPLRCAD